MRSKAIFTLALSACLALIFATVAGGSPTKKVLCAGILCLADDGGISPKKLPKRGKAPVDAHLKAQVITKDGSHPVAFQTMDMKIDRTIELDSRGLPTCKYRQLEATTTAAAIQACKGAIVGRGYAGAEVAFPDQPPIDARGPLILFNGGTRGDKTILLAHVYASIPAPTAIVTRVRLTKLHRGRFGMRIQMRVPRISGGYGSMTGFDLRVGRRFKFRGERKSLLTAGCPTGIWLAKGHVTFVDGTNFAITHVFPCTPRP